MDSNPSRRIACTGVQRTRGEPGGVGKSQARFGHSRSTGKEVSTQMFSNRSHTLNESVNAKR